MSGRILDTAPLVLPSGRDLMVCEIFAGGAEAVHNQLDNAAAVDAGGGIVTIPCTGHGYTAGSMIAIRESTNYDGVYTLAAVAADTFNIYATYTAEVFAAGTVNVRPELWLDRPWQLLDWSIHLSAAGGAAEALTMTLDSAHGATFDVPLHTTADMTAVADISETWAQLKMLIGSKDDAINWTYANTNNKTWGLRARFIVF